MQYSDTITLDHLACAIPLVPSFTLRVMLCQLDLFNAIVGLECPFPRYLFIQTQVQCLSILFRAL